MESMVSHIRGSRNSSRRCLDQSSESALARMRSYEGKKIASPSRGFEV